jgi:hypothetical protein
MGLALLGGLFLSMAARAGGPEREARKEPVLEIMSLDKGDCSLGLSWPWGSMAANHVMFNDHRGPFKAVVESPGNGVRVTFDGWGNDTFAASTDKVRVIYWVAGSKAIDFVAEAMPGGAVRVRPVDRPAAQGKRIVIGIGERTTKDVANVSVEARKD